MATGQTRDTRLITKRTSVPGKIPTGTTLQESNFIRSGELASNLADKKLFGYDGANIFEYGSNSFLGLTGGTISGNIIANSISATTISGGTIYSGNTNLNNIFSTLAQNNAIYVIRTGDTMTGRLVVNLSGGTGTTAVNGIFVDYLPTTTGKTAIEGYNRNSTYGFGLHGSYNWDAYGVGVFGLGYNGVNPPSQTEDIGVYGSSSDIAMYSNGNLKVGSSASAGQIIISNTDDAGYSDIYTNDNRVLRITNSGVGSTGASLQLKSSVDNYLFSFEGRGGFRYWSRVSSGPKFIVNDGGSITMASAATFSSNVTAFSLSATSITATTYYNLPASATTDTFVTAVTISNGILNVARNQGQSTLTASTNNTRELPFNSNDMALNTATRVTLTPLVMAATRFDGTGAIDDAGISFIIPSDYVGSPQFYFTWRATTTSANNAKIFLDLYTGSTNNLGSLTTIAETLNITTNPVAANTFIFSSAATSSISFTSGNTIHARIYRDSADTGDTFTSTLDMININFKYNSIS